MGKPVSPMTKVKKRGQALTCCGWHKHVNKYEKRIGNKYIRGWLKKDAAADAR